MARLTVEVDNWRIKLLDHPEIMDKLCEGLEPGLYFLMIDHEEFCATKRPCGGVCDCDAQFRMEKRNGG